MGNKLYVGNLAAGELLQPGAPVGPPAALVFGGGLEGGDRGGRRAGRLAGRRRRLVAAAGESEGKEQGDAGN